MVHAMISALSMEKRESPAAQRAQCIGSRGLHKENACAPSAWRQFQIFYMGRHNYVKVLVTILISKKSLETHKTNKKLIKTKKGHIYADTVLDLPFSMHDERSVR